MVEVDIENVYGTTCKLSGDYKKWIVGYVRKTNQNLKVD
jgi:hypothetical protein